MQQAITWANIEICLCHRMASAAHDVAIVIELVFEQRNIIKMPVA